MKILYQKNRLANHCKLNLNIKENLKHKKRKMIGDFIRRQQLLQEKLWVF